MTNKTLEPIHNKIPVLQTIKLGACKTPDQYRERLERANHVITDEANAILSKTTCLQQEVELDLVAPDLCELGFGKEELHRYADVCAKAAELGLEFCPAEVGPAMRLQYVMRHHGWPYMGLTIAMTPIAGLVFEVSILHYGYGDHQWEKSGLSAMRLEPNVLLHTSGRVVFVRRKE